MPLFFAFAGLLVGCKGSDSNSAPKVQAPATTEAPRPVPTTVPATTTASSAAENPNEADEASETTASCPGDIAKEPVFENYRSIGVALEIDCAGIITSSYLREYQTTDIAGTLKVLDRSFDLFKDWPNRPAKIVIGDRAFHSSKNDLIHVPYIVSREQDLEDYLHDTRLLMDAEISDFNRAVRLSYVDYKLTKQANGTKLDAGTGALFGYGKAREQIVKDDIARVRKLKKSILQMPFKNVRITHANEMGSFLISQRSESYTLPTEYSDQQLAPYFRYIVKLAQVQKSFEPIAISVIVPAYPTLEVHRAIQALDVLAGAKSTIEKLGVKTVQVLDINISDMRRRFRVSKRNSALIIDNLYGYDGKIQSSAMLAACLDKADLETVSIYYCDGRGSERY